MRALVVAALGDPMSPDPAKRGEFGLRTDVPRPPGPLKPGTVRLAVAAAGLNFADLLQVRGLYQDRPSLPFTPGAEVAGTVVEVGGPATTSERGHRQGLTAGDLVLAVLPRGGGFAEEVVVPAAACFRLPPGTSLLQAAGLAVAYGTADLGLTVRAGLSPATGPSHTVLVSGAGGGVGAAAVQLAMASGARVIALARGPAKAAALTKLVGGGERLTVLDPSALPPGAKRLRDAIAAATGGPRRVSIFLDNVGGSIFDEGLRALRWGGHALIVGFAGGSIPSIPANALLLSSLRVEGVYWGPTAIHEPAAFRAGMERLVALLGSGGLTVPVSHAVPLEDWRDGWAALAERRAFGKVVLNMQPGAKL